VNNIILTLAMAGSSGSGGQSNPMGFFLPLILIFAIMYFLVFRPQARKQKEHQAMLKSINKGDRVITAGGIYGTVVGVKEKENIIIDQIAKDIKIEVAKSSIGRKISETDGRK
jgi:preprotein translocase subunit YajC